MAITFNQITQNADFLKTAGTTMSVITGLTDVVAGDVMIVVVAKDNAASADGATNEITAVADGRGNTYTKAMEYTNANGAANAGATVAIYYSIVTNTIFAGDTITATMTSCTAKAIAIAAYRGSGDFVGPIALEPTTAFAVADGSATSGTLSLSSLTNRTYLFIGGHAKEGLAGIESSSNSFTNLIDNTGSTGGNSATNMSIILARLVSTGTGTSTAATSANSGDWASGLIAFYDSGAGGAPADTWSFFQFF